ncbi:transposase family protein [Treponema pedis]|uniref:transposase family protein n=1 Tax=Treponema pedis TaxID=409322 RepID=UPI003B968330
MGTLANADEWTEIELFAEHNIELLQQYIDLENGVPNHDTIQRAMMMINPDVLQSLVNE